MTPVDFALSSDQTFATIYSGFAIVGTIRRPYVTRAFQNAVPHGAQWEVTDRDGTTVLVTNLRPTRKAVARALGL